MEYIDQNRELADIHLNRDANRSHLIAMIHLGIVDYEGDTLYGIPVKELIRVEELGTYTTNRKDKRK